MESVEKSLIIQEDDTASREYNSEEKEAVPIPVSSKKEALALSGETLKLSTVLENIFIPADVARHRYRFACIEDKKYQPDGCVDFKQQTFVRTTT